MVIESGFRPAQSGGVPRSDVWGGGGKKGEGRGMRGRVRGGRGNGGRSKGLVTEEGEGYLLLQWPLEHVSSFDHQMSLAGGSQVNKFKQVSGLDHKMSVAGGRTGGLNVPCPGRAMYSEVQCIVGNGHMGPPCTDRQTRVKTLPSGNFVGR